MKLSTAIREGAKLRPQGFGQMFGFNPRIAEDFEGVVSCALGAAHEAHFHEYSLVGIGSTALYGPFPLLAEKILPPCGLNFAPSRIASLSFIFRNPPLSVARPSGVIGGGKDA